MADLPQKKGTVLRHFQLHLRWGYIAERGMQPYLIVVCFDVSEQGLSGQNHKQLMQDAALWIQEVLEGASVMAKTFLDHIGEIEDPRIAGMVHYPLSEILPVILVGFLCCAEDIEEMEYLGTEELPCLRKLLPFAQGVAPAQTMRRTLARLNPLQLELAFSGWVAELGVRVRGVIAIDGKTLRWSKHSAAGTGALHLVQAYAHEAGLVLASCATHAKNNEITAIPELLEMIDIHGAIITIDAMLTFPRIG